MSRKLAVFVVIALSSVINGVFLQQTHLPSPGSCEESSGVSAFKVMNFNVQEGGIHPEWKQLVKEENPDIWIAIETGTWDDYGNKKLNDYISEFKSYFDNEYPFTGYTAQEIKYSSSGAAILSRYPILEFDQLDTVCLDDGSPFQSIHVSIYAIIKIGSVEVHFVGTHLKAYAGSIEEEKREKEQEGIINFMDNLGNVPLLYLADMNCFSPQDADFVCGGSDLGTRPINMLINSSDPHASKVHTFRDVFRELNPTDAGYTYPTMNSRIDYIFANSFFDSKLLNSTVGDTSTADTASDHYSVDVFIDGSTYRQADATLPSMVQLILLITVAVVVTRLIKSRAVQRTCRDRSPIHPLT